MERGRRFFFNQNQWHVFFGGEGVVGGRQHKSDSLFLTVHCCTLKQQKGCSRSSFVQPLAWHLLCSFNTMVSICYKKKRMFMLLKQHILWMNKLLTNSILDQIHGDICCTIFSHACGYLQWVDNFVISLEVLIVFGHHDLASNQRREKYVC